MSFVIEDRKAHTILYVTFFGHFSGFSPSNRSNHEKLRKLRLSGVSAGGVHRRISERGLQKLQWIWRILTTNFVRICGNFFSQIEISLRGESILLIDYSDWGRSRKELSRKLHVESHRCLKPIPRESWKHVSQYLAIKPACYSNFVFLLAENSLSWVCPWTCVTSLSWLSVVFSLA